MLNVGFFFLMILSTYRQKLMESLRKSFWNYVLQTSIFCMNNLGFFFLIYTHLNCIVAYYYYNTFYS